MFALGRKRVEDMCYERRRAEACVERARKSHNHTHTRSKQLREGVDRPVHRQDHGDSCGLQYSVVIFGFGHVIFFFIARIQNKN